ncbi:hypothetical protein LTR28_010624 [Elasticomyces elasticus]|nr:hypothetical protein LTR28_010624 [Elasticomyces elasticus]
MTMLKLLRMVYQDRNTAWYLRVFELWGIRLDWHRWKSWEFNHSNPYIINEDEDEEKARNWPEPFVDYSNLSADCFMAEELKFYRSIMLEQLRLTEGECETWMGRLEDGCDEPLKGILIALSEKLERIAFVAYDTWQTDDFSPKHPLEFLCTSLERLHAMDQPVWPAGFQSLRTINVCQTTDLRHPHEAYYANADDIRPLFLLPNIQTLNFSLLGFHNDIDAIEVEQMPAKISSVEKISFYVCALSYSELVNLIGTARALKALAFSFTPSRLADLEQFLAKNYADSFEDFILQSDEAREEARRGPRFDPKVLTSFQKLRHIDICCADLWVLPDSDEAAAEEDAQQASESHPTNGLFFNLQGVLPQSLESVRFLHGPDGLEEVDDRVRLIEGLKSLVESRADGSHLALREICVYDALPADGWDHEFVALQAFAGLVQVCEAYKIDLHSQYSLAETLDTFVGDGVELELLLKRYAAEHRRLHESRERIDEPLETEPDVDDAL